MTDYDIVDKPAHYTEGREIEPIDVIDDWDLGFYEGQVLKYISRAGRKDARLQDLRKAKFYLDRLVNNETPATVIQDAAVTSDKIVANAVTFTPIRPCGSCNGSGSQVVADETPVGDTYNITIDSAKDIASDGVDYEAVADSITKQFEEMHRTGLMARGSSGSYL